MTTIIRPGKAITDPAKTRIAIYSSGELLHVPLPFTKAVSVNANAVAAAGDFMLVDTSAGAVTIDLPEATDNQIVTIGNSGANNVTIDGGAADIGGSGSPYALTPGNGVQLISSGGNWAAVLFSVLF